MTEKQQAQFEIVRNQFEAFDEIAQQLREFEVNKRIRELRYRFLHCRDFKRDDESAEETFRKGIRVAFIGDVPTATKRSLIEAAFSNPIQLQVEDSTGDVHGYFYHRSENGINFTFINTPRINKWIDECRSGEGWQADAAVFIISGTKINDVEKKCLEDLRFYFDSDCLFFVQAAENRTDDSHAENLRIISNVLSIEEGKICVFPPIGSGGVDSFANAFEERFEDVQSRLLKKVLAQLARQSEQFEQRIYWDSKQSLKLEDFRTHFQRVQNQTNEAITKINAAFIKEVDAMFPDDSSYSDIVRSGVKGISSNKKLNLKEMDAYVESITLNCFQVWSERLQDLLKRYVESIISAINGGTSRFEYAYAFVPTNREIQAQILGKFNVVLKSQLGEFNKDFFPPALGASIIRALPSGIFPLYLAFQTATATATTPVGWIVASYVVIGVALIAAMTGVNYAADKRQRQHQAITEIEKDMRVIVRDAARGMKLYFDQASYRSESVAKSIFEEIDAAQQKHIIINSHYPGIRNIDDTLLKKISNNRKSIEDTIQQLQKA